MALEFFKWLLGIVGIVSSEKIFFFGKYVFLRSAVLGVVLTPATDSLTESLWGGAVVALYLGVSLIDKLIGK